MNPSVADAVMGRRVALDALAATGPTEVEVSAPAAGETPVAARLTTRQVVFVVGAAGVVVAFAWLLTEGLVIAGVSVLAGGLVVTCVVVARELIGQFRARESMEEKTLAEPWSTGELAVLSGDEPPLLAGTGAVPVAVGSEPAPLPAASTGSFTGRWADLAAKIARDTKYELARITEVMSGGALS